MSSQEAQSVLKREIESALNEYTRGTLDKQVHVIDISYKSLLSSNKRRDTKSYKRNYDEFLATVQSNATKVDDYLGALTRVNRNLGTCLLEDGGSILLVSKNFDSARSFISKISNLIKENDDFGTAFRSRNYEDIESSRSLARAKGAQFLVLGETGYEVRVVDKNPKTNKYELLETDLKNVKEVLYLAQRRSTDYSKTASLKQFNNAEVTVDADKNVIIKKRILSVLDLGHGQSELAVQATPLGVKLSNVLEMGLSAQGKNLVATYMRELVKLHNVVTFEFKNTSDDTKASGYVVLSIQNYKRNNILSISEGAILNKLRKNIEKLLPNIPGSNTILQDHLEITKNKFVGILEGKAPKKIKKHSDKPSGSATPKISVGSANSKNVNISKSNVKPKPQPVRITEVAPQSYSLASLQLLINSHLQDVISANMGSGNSKNILNYRTGRFAASAKVERMSQSREGMITAFYSYMKNPYQTFEPGYAQGSPKTRDPKLLIAGSIREIAASKVSDRMRAVSL